MNLHEKIIENPLFFPWVFHPTEQLDTWWANYTHENPDESEIIFELKHYFLHFKASDENLNEEEKRALAQQIIHKIQLGSKVKKEKKLFLSFLKYTAIAILFFSLGSTLVYVLMNDRIKEIYLPETQSMVNLNEPVLILPKGENVKLLEKESSIDYSQNGKIVVNKDKVISSVNENDTKRNINQLIIPYGNRSRLTLSDNTVVWLNAGSRLIYPSNFDGNKREVHLFGEAFFDVTHDDERPFIVKTTDVSIKVLGTKFNLCAYPDDNNIQAVLTEGKIVLKRNDASLFESDIIILPDQIAWYNKTSKITKVKLVDTSYYTLWKDGLMKFTDEDLSRVIKKLERFYNISFKFNDPLDGSIKINGKLDLQENKEEVFKYISKVALVEIIKDKGNKYIIK